MNEKQFNIVKVFQGMGANHKKLAKTFKEPEDKIVKAYNAKNYEDFKKIPDMSGYMNGFKDMFGL